MYVLVQLMKQMNFSLKFGYFSTEVLQRLKLNLTGSVVISVCMKNNSELESF